MKYLFICLFLIFGSSFILAQDYKVEVNKDSIGIHYLLLKSNDKIIANNIHGFAFKIEILDFLVIDSNTLCIIYKSPLHIQYDKFIRIEDNWERSPFSGVLAGNNEYIPFKDPKFDLSDKSYKIIKEDLVQVKSGDEIIIKDCIEFKKK